MELHIPSFEKETCAPLGIDWCGQLDTVPAVFAEFPYWQYGTGERYSERRTILDSIVLSYFTPDVAKTLFPPRPGQLVQVGCRAQC